MIGAAGAGVVGVLGFAIYFLFNAYTAQVELRVTSEVGKVSAEAALREQARALELQAEFQNRLNEREAEYVDAQNRSIAEINKLRLVAEKKAELNPTAFGDAYHVRLARIMCRIEGGSNRAKRDACNSAAAETYLSDIAFTLTATADTAERWQELCEDGQDDFCRWSITGMTPQGALTLLAWLEQVDRYAAEQAEQIDNLHALIDRLQNKE